MKSGGFSEAARQIGVTPAAVAKQMAQLEKQLGFRLFDRNTRHLKVTEEGALFLQTIQSPLLQIQQMMQSPLQNHAHKGRVKVSVPASFAKMAVLPALPLFQAAYPDIELDIRLENRRVNLLAESYDCAIGSALEPDANLVARPLAQFYAVLCASPAYLKQYGQPQQLEDLHQHRCIAMRSDISGRVRDWVLTSRKGKQVFKPSAQLQLTDPESLAAAAMAGSGIALVGIHHVNHALKSGQLQRVLPELQGEKFKIYIYYPKRHLLPKRTKLFVDHVITHGSKKLASVHV
jgi:DNA-binding transcriptional LysR family regulator